MTNSQSTRRALRGLLAVLSIAGLTLTACGEDGDDGAGAESTATTDGAAESTTPDSGATDTTTAESGVQPTQIDVTMTDFELDIPAEIPAGFVRVTATNDGAVEHHLILAKLKDGVTVDALLQTMATDQAAGEAMIEYRGGPNGVAPGGSESAQLNLDAGDYIALCVIPDAEGVAHVAHGMFAPVTVTGEDAPADLSAVDVEATISLTDYDFTMSDGFDGKGLVLATVNAPQPHEVAVYRIGEGGSMEEFMKMLGRDPSITPEIAARYTLAGGLTPIASGTSAVIEFDLEPGDYVFICFVADATDSLPHFLHNMVKLVTIPA